MHTLLPALLAVLAAIFIAVGTVLRQQASVAGGTISAQWVAGAAVALTGFASQALALSFGSILLVQPLIVLAVLFALPLEAWLDRRRPHHAEWAWGGALVVSVGVFLGIARPNDVSHRPNHVVIAVAVAVVIGLVVALVLVAVRVGDHYRALCFGLVAGVLFGVCALLIKTVSYLVIHEPLHVWSHAEVYLFAVSVIGGVWAQQCSFVAGELQTSFPAMTVAEPAVSMALGVMLLGEVINVGVLQAVVMVAVSALMIASVIALARMSAARGEAL